MNTKVQSNPLFILHNIFHGKYNNFIVIFLAMSYAMIKLTCNLMFLRPLQTSLIFFESDLIIPAATLLYPIIYVISICIMLLSNKRVAIIVVLTGILCDGIFSFGSGSIIKLPIPHKMTASELENTISINIIGGYMWNFYLKGIIISIIVSILSLESFIKLKNKNVPFFINMLISTYLPTIVHHMQMLSPTGNFSIKFEDFKEYTIVYLSVLIVYIMVVLTIRQLSCEVFTHS